MKKEKRVIKKVISHDDYVSVNEYAKLHGITIPAVYKRIRTNPNLEVGMFHGLTLIKTK